MSLHDERHLNRAFDRLQRRLPPYIGHPLRGLRTPALRWVRIPVGILLVLGGIFSILPVFGLWMLPIGVLLLAQDLPFLRRPTRRAMLSGERRWLRWRRARRARRGN